MAYQSFNPATGKLVKSFDQLTDEQLEAKLAAAAQFYLSWKQKPYAERAPVIARAAEILRAKTDEFAAIMTLEMGKKIREARGEIAFSADILDYYAENAERFLAPTALHPTVGEAHMESSPIGVVFCVEPWNFPYYQLARVAGPQLMAGNVLVVKHAACVPQCAIAFEQLLRDAGSPAGLYTNLPISHAQSDIVIDDPRVKGVALTGSVGAGRTIAARAGQNLKPSSMELGGSDAFIVLEDADLDHTVKWAVWGRMYNSGQTCCAAKRFIVVDKLADAFLERFAAALGAIEAGNPTDQKTSMGPLASEDGLLHLLEQVRQAVDHGAKALIGGKR
ncbi:aldehyde dehydrogenase family protein, partial [uncultured Rhodoblastus sp.]|uniref:aldehyde dehydrogenase family protein n=1 Tax=uncultured Rhodoblastus sp. TaxID=543037 RepID=UPI0025DF92A3